MRIVWRESEVWPISRGLGVEFFGGDVPRGGTFFAFLQGYRWMHEAPEEVVIVIQKPDKMFSKEFLSEARKTIEEALLAGKLKEGMLNDKITAWFNA